MTEHTPPTTMLDRCTSNTSFRQSASTHCPLFLSTVVIKPAPASSLLPTVVQDGRNISRAWDKAIKQTEDDYYRDNPGVKPYGLTSIPLTYEPAVTPQSPLSFVQQEKPERRDLARCWRQKEPARKLVALGERPIMVLEAEAS